MINHWHVQSKSSILEPPETFSTAVEALEFAAEILVEISDSEHEMKAFIVFCRVSEYETTTANLRNMARNANVDETKRAPLYRNEPVCGPRWRQALDHLHSSLVAPHWFDVWECTESCLYGLPDDGE